MVCDVLLPWFSMCSSSSHFQQSSLQMFWFFKNFRGYSSPEILSNLFQPERWWRLHQLWSPYNLRCNQSLLLQKQIEKKQYSDYCLLTMQDRAMNKQLQSVLISRIIVSLPEISDVRNCFWSSVLNELIKVEIKFKMHLYIFKSWFNTSFWLYNMCYPKCYRSVSTGNILVTS